MRLLKNCWVSWAFISWAETPRSAIVLWDSTMALASSWAAWFIRCCCCSSIGFCVLLSLSIFVSFLEHFNSAYVHEQALDMHLRGSRHPPLGPLLARRRSLPRDRPDLGFPPLLGPLLARRRVFPATGGRRSSCASDPAIEVPQELSALLVGFLVAA